MLPYDNYVDLMRELDELVSAFQAHPDPHTRDAAMALLNGLDLLHREGLQRLVAALRERNVGHALEEGVEEDRVMRAFLGLYDLAELDLPPTAPEERDGGASHDPADGPPGGAADGASRGAADGPTDGPAGPTADSPTDGPPTTGFVPLSHLRYRRKEAGERPKDRSQGDPEGDEE